MVQFVHLFICLIVNMFVCPTCWGLRNEMTISNRAYFTAKLVIFYPSSGVRKGKGLCAWFINEFDRRACDY